MLTQNQNAKASHFPTGEITYKNIDTYKYEVYLTLFRQCDVSALNDSIRMTISCRSGTSQEYFYVNRTSITDVTRNCDTAAKWCASPNTPGKMNGFEKHVYKGILDLYYYPKSAYKNCDILQIFLSACCRTNNTTSGSAGKVAYLEATLYPKLAPSNSSPTFNNVHSPYLACNQPTYINYAVFDGIDGDSLSYSLIAPMEAGGNSISYNGKLSATQPFSVYDPTGKGITNTNANPPMGFHLDPITGTLTFTPTKCDESGPIVMLVTEWRKDTLGVYQKIGTVMRDMHYSVKTTPVSNNPEILASQNIYHFCAGSSWCIPIATSDKVYVPPPPLPTPSPDSVRLEWFVTFEGGSMKIIKPNQLNDSALFCWTPDSSDIRSEPYFIHLTAIDNACPANHQTDKTITIYVHENTFSEVSIKPLSCNRWIYSSNPSKGTGYQYQWEVLDTAGHKIRDANIVQFFQGINAESKRKTDTLQIHQPGIYVVKHTFTGNCTYEYFDTIEIKHVFKVDIQVPKNQLCMDSSAFLYSSFANAKGKVDYMWYLNGFKSNAGNSSTFTFNPDSADRSYVITIHASDSLGCIASASDTIISLPELKFHLDPRYEICAGEVLKLKLDSLAINAKWSNGSTKNNAEFTTTGGIKVWYQDTNLCSYAYSTQLKVWNLPTINFQDTQSCEPSLLIDVGEFNTYVWAHDPKAKNPITVYNTWNYKVTVVDSNGCKNSKKAYIEFDQPIPFDLGNDIAQCDSSVVLEAGPYILNANDFSWSTGSKTSKILIETSGHYSLEVEDSNGCFFTDSLFVEITKTPQSPFITLNNQLLESNQSGFHYWYKDDKELIGENLNYLPASKFGKGVFTASSELNDCKSEPSNSIGYLVGVDESDLERIVIYPNPSNGVFYWSFGENEKIDTYNIMAHDLVSKEISLVITKVDDTTLVLDTGSFKGMLWLIVELSDGVVFRRMVYVF